MVRDASDFYGTVRMNRESSEEITEEIVTEVPTGSLVQDISTILTDANVDASVRGDGIFAEDIDVAYTGKARAMKLRELDGSGNFSLNTSLQLSGVQIKRGFGLLNETEMFDRRVEMAYDKENGTGPMGGI